MAGSRRPAPTCASRSRRSSWPASRPSDRPPSGRGHRPPRHSTWSYQMTNRELLNTPKEKLSALDRQKQHTLRLELTPVPCPVCRTALDALTAAGIDVEQYDFGKSKYDYRCPHCQAELELFVPFIAFGLGWHWQINPGWLTEMLAKAWAYDRERPRKEV